MKLDYKSLYKACNLNVEELKVPLYLSALCRGFDVLEDFRYEYSSGKDGIVDCSDWMKGIIFDAVLFVLYKKGRRIKEGVGFSNEKMAGYCNGIIADVDTSWDKLLGSGVLTKEQERIFKTYEKSFYAEGKILHDNECIKGFKVVGERLGVFAGGSEDSVESVLEDLQRRTYSGLTCKLAGVVNNGNIVAVQRALHRFFRKKGVGGKLVIGDLQVLRDEFKEYPSVSALLIKNSQKEVVGTDNYVGLITFKEMIDYVKKEVH